MPESRRDHAQPLSLWTWSKVVRRIVLASGVERFSTHATRHRHTDSTLRYIHLPGRELAEKLSKGMQHIHVQRVQALTGTGATEVTR
jgi:integrase/recombinase XerD